MNPESHHSVSSTSGSDDIEISVDPVPVWLIVVGALLLYGGALYFDHNGGWFSARVYAPYHSVEQLQSFQITGEVDMSETGRRVYNKPTCVQCHMPNGLGTPGTFPPLAGSEWVNEPEPGRLIRIVLNGLQGPMTVSGKKFENSMIAWGGPPPPNGSGLTDEEIAAVLTYVRQNKEWGNNAPPVTTERVKSVRDKIKNHPAAFTADELLKVAPAD